jgi:hypothetical protein
MPEGIDLIMPGPQGATAYGSVAQKLLTHGLNLNALRTLDVLRKDEWVHFDEALLEITRQRLKGVADLLSAGLTLPLANAMGTTVVEWERSSDMDPATRSMDGLTRDRDDRIEFDRLAIPIFITHKDFSLNLRSLEASRTLGQALDTTQIEVCTRRVNDSLEDALFNGLGGYTVAASTAYGYTTHPNRNTFEFSSGSWTTATGEQILADVLDMIGILHGDNMFGPFVMYVPTLYWVAMQADFKANSDRTIMERVRAVEDISDIRVADFLTADNVVMVQLTRDVVDEVVGFQPTVVQWDEAGGFKLNFKVMAIMVPRIKADYNGNSGICHASTASGGG